jgi:hypothetical protein
VFAYGLVFGAGLVAFRQTFVRRCHGGLVSSRLDEGSYPENDLSYLENDLCSILRGLQSERLIAMMW